ncbi:MAG: LytTR family transcriptional regulator DNA-binding domain-containing protein [Treponema sp.]|nr:LytTR family transcriptional regulator DNA-binding domain-containing protein [Treponema sp.]
MLIKLKQDMAKKDIEVTIEYPVKDKTVDRIISLVKSADVQIECYLDDSTKLINVSEIYHVESIDKKTVIFDEKQSYYSKNRLYQLYEKLRNKGFVQISKYCIVNINKLERITPMANSHLEAVLSNGTSLYVTRKYLADIKNALKEGE